MRYDSQIIEQVVSLNDIVEIISDYVSLKKGGRSFKGLCPFHSEKTPSFHVNPERQIFHCFGCGVGGDAIEFLQKVDNITFPEALELLAKRVHFKLPQKNFSNPAKAEEAKDLTALYDRALQYYRAVYQSKAGDKAREYMAKRNFGKEILETFEVGFSLAEWRGLSDTLLKEGFREDLLLKSGLSVRSPKGGLYDLFRERVLFPIRNTQGKIIGFGGRVINPEGKPKYLNSPETEWFKKGRELFALWMAKKKISTEKPKLYIVEGYLDCLRLHEAGIQNTVATLGTALTEEHVKLLRRYAEEAVLIFDGDKAGASASFRSLDVFLEAGFPVKVATLEGGMDPDDYVREKGADAFRAKLEQAEDFFIYKLRYLQDHFSSKDASGLLKITSNLLEVIAKMPSEILQHHYLHQLASKLNIDESSLRLELGKLKVKLQRTSEMKGVQPANKPAEPLVLKKEEIHLLYLLSESEGAGKLGEASEEFFTHPSTLRAFQILKEVRKDRPLGSCFSIFLMRLDEVVLKQRIVELSFLEWTTEERSKALQDCLRHVKRSQFEKERKALEAKIRSAEEKGELERLKEYLKDFQHLSLKGSREYEA